MGQLEDAQSVTATPGRGTETGGAVLRGALSVVLLGARGRRLARTLSTHTAQLFLLADHHSHTAAAPILDIDQQVHAALPLGPGLHHHAGYVGGLGF